MNAAREALLTGRATPPAPPRPVRAGELTLELDGPDVRRVGYRGIEVAGQVYFAVRDGPWNTLPGVVSDLHVVEQADAFEVGYRSRHRFEALDFDLECVGAIEGTAEGELLYRVEVTAHSPIEYSRIGLNLLHGARTYAGRPFRSWLKGDLLQGELPRAVGAQPIVGGRLAGLIAPFDRLELSPLDGVTVRYELEGDEFEMEDQRNFGDSGFKTYSTPLQRPSPFRLEPGQTLRQAVRISVRDERREAYRPVPPGAPVVLRVGRPSGRHMPSYGLGQAADGPALSPAERERVAPLQPSHLRVELVLSEGLGTCLDRLRLAGTEAQALGCALWVDVSADLPDPTLAVDVARAACRTDPAPAFIHLATTIDEPPDEGMSALTLAEIRSMAAVESPSTVVGVGSYRWFADLNREPFDGSIVGSLTFATCPTIHRADDATVLENIDNLADEVVAMRRHLGRRHLTIGPVTLAARHGPYPAGPRQPGDLPSRVDERQVSLLATAVTVGHLAELAPAEVDGLTFFETAGPLGVAERDGGSAWPDRFRSRPGLIYPLWHALADATELRGGRILGVELAPDPVFTAPVACFAVRDASGTHVLVASLERHPQSVVIDGLSGTEARVRQLDIDSAEVAMTDPHTFRRSGRTLALDGSQVRLELGPYAFVRVDCA